MLVVCCADPVPAPYQATDGAESFRHAWAARLRVVDAGGFSLGAATPANAPDAARAEFTAIACASLRAMTFLTGAGGAELHSETGRYLWTRRV